MASSPSMPSRRKKLTTTTHRVWHHQVRWWHHIALVHHISVRIKVWWVASASRRRKRRRPHASWWHTPLHWKISTVITTTHAVRGSSTSSHGAIAHAPVIQRIRLASIAADVSSWTALMSLVVTLSRSIVVTTSLRIPSLLVFADCDVALVVSATVGAVAAHNARLFIARSFILCPATFVRAVRQCFEQLSDKTGGLYSFAQAKEKRHKESTKCPLHLNHTGRYKKKGIQEPNQAPHAPSPRNSSSFATHVSCSPTCRGSCCTSASTYLLSTSGSASLLFNEVHSIASCQYMSAALYNLTNV